VYDLYPGTDSGHDIRVKVYFTDDHTRTGYIKGIVQVAPVRAGYSGDIRGIYLDARSNSPFTTDVFASSIAMETPVTGATAQPNRNSLGNGNSVPQEWGAGGLHDPGFDLGIEIGTQGQSPDFYSTAVFWIDNTKLGNSFSLSPSMPTIEEIGVRVTSIGPMSPQTGQRIAVDDSGKYHYTNSVPVATPEPSTYALMAAGLAALGFVRRRITARNQ
jgi:hypothetical protein